MLIYSDIQSPDFQTVAGCCPTSQDFLILANDSVRRLMTRGNWYGTVKKIQVCAYGGCITWPRYVGTVLATNICHHPRPVVGNWWEFMPLNGGDIGSRPGEGEFWLDGRGGWCGRQSAVTENDGWSPVYNQISCNTGNYLRAYPRCQNDLGKTITFFGIDTNGQKLMQRDGSGNWSDGITLILGLPFTSSQTTVRKVDRVVKDQTQCPVDCYQYDAVNDVLLDLAHYDGQETVPNYKHTVISHFRHGHSVNGQPSGTPRPQQITALIKVAYQDIVNPTDHVLIDSKEALKQEFIALKKEQALDFQGAKAFESAAIHALNMQLRDTIPIDQIPVTIESFGTALPRRRAIGRIV